VHGDTSPDLPAYVIDASAGRDRLRQAEWVLTNGIGGFAMGTAAGMPTRRYHALLVGAMEPPVQREVLLHSMVETLVLGAGTGQERAVDLCCFRFGGERQERGDRYLVRFERTPAACRWVWRVEEVEVVKTLRLFHGWNAAEVEYRVSGAAGLVRFQARPLVGLRDAHAMLSKDAAGEFRVESTQRRARVRRIARTLDLGCDAGWFQEEPQWWYGFEYDRDRERGYDSREDLYSPGVFSIQVRPAAPATLAITAWVGEVPGGAGDHERMRRTRLGGSARAAMANAGPGTPDREAIVRLAAAADDFVVRRGENGVSVVAGYPWFTDWGRDSMISLPGLLLCTGRLDEARAVLMTLASHRRNGLIPNRFHDHTGEPEFNTVDASLWFIHAACEWLRAGGARGAWGEIGAACVDIVEAYRSGTDFGIRMDAADGLITAGDETTQLTWMDARRDGVVFTPRHGKAVEINALWVHGLRSLAAAEPRAAGEWARLADEAATSFNQQFWNEAAGCCYDVLTPTREGRWAPDAKMRPNQIFAASLGHSPLAPARRAAVVRVIKERLLTPAGLRTLDPADPDFKGRYGGGMWERDAAYHNGTVWPWLLGAYAEAVLRAGGFSAAARAEARAALEPLIVAMGDEFLGLVPEVFDGDDEPGRPRRAGGCVHQAWSVAELLRGLCLVTRGGRLGTPRA
jgi:predicted glycogen debranching enzyme